MENVIDLAGKTVAGAEKFSLCRYSVGNCYMGPAPKERHLIENFVVHESTIALAADGGVGKTYIALELALRAAIGSDIGSEKNEFLGFRVLEKCCVVMLTMEDDKQSIHRRICSIDPDGSLREAAGDNCLIIPIQDALPSGFVLAEKDASGNYSASRVWRYLCQEIQEYLDSDDARKNMPLLVIIDTYSATHHADENSATGTNEWFRAAGLLKMFKGTLVVTHHVRKTDPREEIRTPSDMRVSVRGSNAFMNNIRTCYGIWPMPNANSVLKEMEGEQERVKLFNMGLLKNNTGINWDDRSDPRYPEPMITLRRTSKGQLVYDADVHDKRLNLANNKEKRLEEQRLQLRAAIIFACRWYAEHEWPLSKAKLTREKLRFLPGAVNQMAYKNEIEPMIESLLSEGWIKEIKIKGTNGHVFDVANGPYSSGVQAQRISMAPVLPWDDYEYDAENRLYIAKQKRIDL